MTTDAAPLQIEIQPLTPRLLPALAALFEQGGDPRWCWCAYFRVRGRDWTNSGPAENRPVLEAAAIASVATGRAPGLVALRGGEAIGWVSLGPREDFVRLAHSRVLGPLDDRPVWSIVCFVVGRGNRGRGVASALLAAAIDYARSMGAVALEAYPVDTSAGRVPSANLYRGSLRMFERAGFTIAAMRQSGVAAKPRIIVRLDLA